MPLSSKAPAPLPSYSGTLGQIVYTISCVIKSVDVSNGNSNDNNYDNKYDNSNYVNVVTSVVEYTPSLLSCTSPLTSPSALCGRLDEVDEVGGMVGGVEQGVAMQGVPFTVSLTKPTDLMVNLPHSQHSQQIRLSKPIAIPILSTKQQKQMITLNVSSYTPLNPSDLYNSETGCLRLCPGSRIIIDVVVHVDGINCISMGIINKEKFVVGSGFGKPNLNVLCCGTKVLSESTKSLVFEFDLPEYMSGSNKIYNILNYPSQNKTYYNQSNSWFHVSNELRIDIIGKKENIGKCLGVEIVS
jgi:hypothetical protein